MTNAETAHAPAARASLRRRLARRLHWRKRARATVAKRRVQLVLLILLHSGRGGGLSDMFGGGVGQAAAGSTMVERNLDRLTVATALIFSFTTVILAIRLQ